jgi:hypothetical protein
MHARGGLAMVYGGIVGIVEETLGIEGKDGSNVDERNTMKTLKPLILTAALAMPVAMLAQQTTTPATAATSQTAATTTTAPMTKTN